MKILITYPPLSSFNKVPLLSQNRQFQWFSNPTFLYPLVPASAATLLSANGFNVIWKDAIAEQITYDQFLEFFQDQNPDLVVMETKTPVIKKHWQIIWDLKQIFPETKFALMGDHVTALPEESLRECPGLDFVITGGDYDFSLLALARYLKGEGELPTGVYYRKGGNIVSTGQPRLDNDLDSLPLIDRDLTRFQLYKEANIKRRPFAYTMAGRDCPYHKCRFCSWTTLYPNFRVRSPENYIKEIGLLVERYGVREIFDDTGTFPSGDWLDRFCQLMIEQGYHKELLFSCNFRFDYLQDQKRAELMKKAGFRLVKSGLESANQETLDRLKKGFKVEDIVNGCRIARAADLEVHLTMMIGFPWETRKQVNNTLSLAHYLMSKGLVEVLQSTIIVPYPGTPLHQEAVENGWFRIGPADYSRYDMAEPVLSVDGISPEEIMQLCSKNYKVYFSPGYILHRLARLRSWDDVKYHADGVRAVLKHINDFTRKK